jgi:zinc protease
MLRARPAATEVIAKYVAAIGGQAEIMKVTSFKQLGTVSIPAQGISGTMEVMAAAPNKAASTTTIPGFGDIVQGFDGKSGWSLMPMQGPRLLEGKELEGMADASDFYGTLLYSPDRFSTLETVGDTTINGEKAFIVKMVRKVSQQESRTYFSATTGLLIGSATTVQSQMGPMEMKQFVSAYKKFGALSFPTKMTQESGPQKIELTINDVLINGAPASAFEAPAQVKALIKPIVRRGRARVVTDVTHTPDWTAYCDAMRPPRGQPRRASCVPGRVMQPDGTRLVLR